MNCQSFAAYTFWSPASFSFCSEDVHDLAPYLIVAIEGDMIKLDGNNLITSQGNYECAVNCFTFENTERMHGFVEGYNEAIGNQYFADDQIYLAYSETDLPSEEKTRLKISELWPNPRYLLRY
jgi:hypothetical protein